MNRRESVALFGLAQNYFPTLKANDYTPDAWADILDDITFDDGRQALIALCKREAPFTSVGEIRSEARRMRRDRLEKHPPLVPPSELSDDEQRKWMGNMRKSVADGQSAPVLAALPQRDMAVVNLKRLVKDLS